VSLTFPSEANLVSGDNPVYIGDLNRGESVTVNWKLNFTAVGVFSLDVNASGFSALTGAYTEIHGYASVTIVEPPPPPASGGVMPSTRPLMK